MGKFTKYAIGYSNGDIVERVSDSILSIVIDDTRRSEIEFVMESKHLDKFKLKENKNE